MAQSPRVLLLWAAMVTTALSVVECTCHEQGSDQVTPPVITSVMANRVSDEDISEILIEWTDKAGSSDVNRYVFFFGFQMNGQGCISAGTQSKRIEYVNSTFSATVHHTLDPFVKYTVQVAQDWSGSRIGRKSNAFEFGLNATLHIKELKNKSIEIQWPQPAKTSNITGFIWEYSTKGLEEFVHKNKSSPLSSSVTSAVLDGLEEGARYRISVKASTSHRTAENAVLTATVKTPPGIPAKPQNLTGKEDSPVIALSWLAPPARDRNGDIIAYKIRFTSPSGVTRTINVKVEANESRRAEWNYTILEVQRGVKYTVEVAAATEGGTGNYTVTEVTTTSISTTEPPTTPFVPTDPVNGTDDAPRHNSFPLLYVAIPVGVTIAVLGGVILVTLCILIKVKRTATKAAHSLAIAQSQLTQQEENNYYTGAHIYEDPEAVVAEYRKENEANNHTFLPFNKEAFLPTDDRFAGGYAILEAGSHYGDAESEASSLCESILESTCPADYEKPRNASTAPQSDADPPQMHSQSEDTAGTSAYTDLMSSTLNPRDYETPVIQNGNVTCATPA